MAHGGGHERETLGKFVRTQSGYGTTVTNAKTSQHKSSKYIKHIVCKGDTLMGLSLKYHVTVEVLKRENKLWNNDMLFLRECILIPLTPDNEDFADSELIVTVAERDRSTSSVSNGSHSSSASDKEASSDGQAGEGGEAEGTKKDNPLDILNKYDSNIAKLKSDVAKMKTNADDALTRPHTPGRSMTHCLGTDYDLILEKETEC
ncbi:lysM and putative peptidoglycan-binding domain-containing protein 1-like isoform X3 [Babylonia areolata]|uniref:lysM and putative peptidoglycan-binding domain-containing protein 1-like isoform X3 n=1 Tax=Babylonia areolata TaxID=304850 RepID=UPI003FD4FC5A